MTKEEAIAILEFHKYSMAAKEESLYYEELQMIEALEMAIEALEKNVAYLCDEKQCPDCNQSECRDCWYTTDIHHAKNFVEAAPGKWMEIYVIPTLKVRKD